MPPPLVISCSLNPESKSRRLARLAATRLRSLGRSPNFLDLAEVGLPMCDGESAHTDPRVAPVREQVAGASGILLAFPVYNYDANSAAKNLIELTGKAWTGKVVGLLAAAGGRGSYMAPLGLANSLMLDFQCLIVPRVVVVPEDAFSDETLSDAESIGFLHDLVDRFAALTAALRM